MCCRSWGGYWMSNVNTRKLGDICTIVSGGTPSRSKLEYWNGGTISWIKISNIKNKYVNESDEKITKLGLEESSAKMLTKGTILYTIFATLGEVAILDIDACTNQAIAGINIKNTDILINDFLYYFLMSKKDYVNNIGRGVAQNNINMSILRNIDIPLPPIDIQRKIVSNLDKVTHIMDLCNTILEKLDLLVKSQFVEMFGDPGTNPKEWNETTIGKECYYIKDGPHKSLQDIGKENGGHPFISVRNIVNGYIDFSTAKYISDDDYFDAIKKCNPEKGDMLYSKGGTTGIAKLVDIDEQFANWVHVAVLKFDKLKINGIFFENMLNLDYCYQQSQRLTKGIANRDLVLSSIAQIQIYNPPLDLQNQFADFVKTIDKSKIDVQLLIKNIRRVKFYDQF